MKNYKEITKQLIDSVNTQYLENLKELFSKDATMTVFMTRRGQYSKIHGVEEIIRAFKLNFENKDVKFNLSKLIAEENTVAISGYLVGTQFFNIQLDEEDTFHIKFMAFFEFKNNKISNMDFSSHTFEDMRLSGIATFKHGNMEEISKYLAILKQSGLIPQKMILSST